MIATGIALEPPLTANNNPKATPELLAACLAKYSRSNDGIQTILGAVDPGDPDKSVDKIFHFVDYGHASIAGLTGGIAITLDGVSMLLAYKLFEFAQLSDGQESSTRYIKMQPSNLCDAKLLGIPEELQEEWESVMVESLRLYHEIHRKLEDDLEKNPSLLKVPQDTPEKKLVRLRRNYGLDRARYVLPLALKTNIALVMSARAWIEVIKQLESLALPEAVCAASLLREELKKFAPRLIKHSFSDESSTEQATQLLCHGASAINSGPVSTSRLADDALLEIYPDNVPFIPQTQQITDGFLKKVHRYSTLGPAVKRVMVRFAWNNIAIAEVRDLNRHRTGNRFTPLIPVGFYIPEEVQHSDLPGLLARYAGLIKKLAAKRIPGIHLYGYLLGTQITFEHSTHLDKLIYEIELRTGDGAHFRYAEHLRAIAGLLIKRYPELSSHINIGTAEPEII